MLSFSPDASSGPVDIGSVFDAEHRAQPESVVDLVEDTERSPAGRVNAGQFVAQFFTDPLRILQQAARDELDHRCDDSLGKLELDCPGCGGGHLQFVRLELAHVCGRKARTASTPRTTSPRTTSPRASLSSASVCGSARISNVSSSAARSSYPMSTAAGRPLRVTTMRSCSRSARSTKSDRWSRTARNGSTVMA